MSVVIAGATGHLGRLVIDHLLSSGVPGETIVAGGRRPEALAQLEARGVVPVTLDYSDTDSLTTAFDGADTVLLISGSEVGRRVEQHRNVIEAARTAGVRRIVYTSTPHADTAALILAPDHKATEEMLQASGLAVTVLRNNWYTENYLPTVEQARGTGEVVASAGDGRVASATRADLAAGIAAVLMGEGHDGKVYELTGDVAWSFDELAAAISEVLGRPVTYRAVSAEEHLVILTGAGLDEQTAGFVVALDGDIRNWALADATGDLSRLIGRPTTSLVDGLRTGLVRG